MNGSVRLTLSEVAELVDGRVEGDGSVRVRGVAPLDEAGEDQLGLLADRRYRSAAAASAAGALLVSEDLADPDDPRPQVVVGDAHAALAPLLERLHPAVDPEPGIHPTAVVGPGVQLGVDVSVGPYAVIEEGAVLGERVRIGAHCVIGRGSRIGAGSLLHPHVVLYANTEVGRRVILHAGARLGVDGFGYAFQDGAFRKIPQVGRCVVEDDVEIGANTCLDRGSIGDTRVGRGTKLDNLVHLAHNVRMGPSCAAAAQVGIAGSTRVGAGVLFAGQSGVVGHVTIGDRAQIGAKSAVIGDVAEGESVAGFPARDLKQFMKSSAVFLKLPELLRRVRKLEASRSGDGAPDRR